MTLLDRLKELKGPSREVDLDLALNLASDVVCLRYNVDTHTNEPFVHWEYTRVADDAAALIDRVLPSWAHGYDKGPKTCIAFVDPHDHADRFLGARHTAEGPTPAIALLIALLTALEPGKTEGGGNG